MGILAVIDYIKKVKLPVAVRLPLYQKRKMTNSAEHFPLAAARHLEFFSPDRVNRDGFKRKGASKNKVSV